MSENTWLICIHLKESNIWFLKDAIATQSQNHQMVWVERDHKVYVVPNPCHGGEKNFKHEALKILLDEKLDMIWQMWLFLAVAANKEHPAVVWAWTCIMSVKENKPKGRRTERSEAWQGPGATEQGGEAGFMFRSNMFRSKTPNIRNAAMQQVQGKAWWCFKGWRQAGKAWGSA